MIRGVLKILISLEEPEFRADIGRKFVVILGSGNLALPILTFRFGHDPEILLVYNIFLPIEISVWRRFGNANEFSALSFGRQ